MKTLATVAVLTELLLLCLWSPVSWAGWTQPAGGSYLKAGVRGLVGSAYMDEGGVAVWRPGGEGKVQTEPYQDWAVRLYAEYGLRDALTLTLDTTPVGFSRFGSAQTLYIGATRLGLRQRVLSGRHNIALTGHVGGTPPVGDQDLSRGSINGGRYSPVAPGLVARGGVSYGIGLGQNWLRLDPGVEVLSRADLDPVVDGSAQVGHTSVAGHRLAVTVPFRVPLGPIDAPINITGAGQTRYLGIEIGYTHQLGQQWGLSTALVGALAAAANLEAVMLPLYFERWSLPD